MFKEYVCDKPLDRRRSFSTRKIGLPHSLSMVTVLMPFTYSSYFLHITSRCSQRPEGNANRIESCMAIRSVCARLDKLSLSIWIAPPITDSGRILTPPLRELRCSVLNSDCTQEPEDVGDSGQSPVRGRRLCSGVNRAHPMQRSISVSRDRDLESTRCLGREPRDPGSCFLLFCAVRLPPDRLWISSFCW